MNTIEEEPAPSWLAPGSFEGRVALVTGGASGLGRAAAVAIARGGAAVHLVDTDEELGRPLAAQLGCAFHCLDVTDERGWDELHQRIMRSHGRLHVAITAAGIGGPMATVKDMPIDAWRRVMAVNVEGTMLAMRAAMRLMTDGGSIVTLASTGGLRGAPFLSAYCASKGAIRLLTRAAAAECARTKTGIRVNCIAPGAIDTPLLDRLLHSTPFGPAATSKMLLEGIPLGRFGRPSELAAAVCFLASDASSYMTGSELVVEGGLTAS